MIFSSWQFLGFMCALLSLFVVFKNTRFRVLILLLFSYIFYGAWDYKFIPLLLSISIISWVAGFIVNKNRFIATIISVLACLIPLVYFKYLNFLAGNLNYIAGSNFKLENIALPLGISFFTFQAVSYVVDRYKNRIPPCNNPIHYMLYIAFFPQLIAGPIVRAEQLLPQLTKSITITKPNLLIGLQIFLAGMVQKLIVTDNLSIFVDAVYAEPKLFSTATLWLSMLSFSIQIFCDFSAYSLMAIGLAKIFGITLPINFNMPYNTLNIISFWNCWHITLTSWVKDYIFKPLTKNCHNRACLWIYIILSMLLIGLWHGASWNFVVWGGLNGLAIVINHWWKKIRRKNLPKLATFKIYKFASWLLMLTTVNLFSVIFRGQTWGNISAYYKNLFNLNQGLLWLPPQIIIILCGVFIWHLMALYKPTWIPKYPFKNPFQPIEFTIISLTIMGLIMFGATKASPFVYFQF